MARKLELGRQQRPRTPTLAPRTGKLPGLKTGPLTVRVKDVDMLHDRLLSDAGSRASYGGFGSSVTMPRTGGKAVIRF